MLNVREARTDERLDDLNAKVVAALVGLIATQLGLILTQL